MSSFTRASLVPDGTRERGRNFSRVRGEAGDGFEFYVGDPETGQRIHVPEGFRTDGASVPTWLLWLVGLLWGRLRRWIEERLLKAAIVHDRLREDLNYSLIEADAYFLIALAADGLRWDGQAATVFHRAARVLLREAAFWAVRTNRSRVDHQFPDGETPMSVPDYSTMTDAELHQHAAPLIIEIHNRADAGEYSQETKDAAAGLHAAAYTLESSLLAGGQVASRSIGGDKD